MYSFLLTLHSWIRWLLVLDLIAFFTYTFWGLCTKKIFTLRSYYWLQTTFWLLCAQIVIGISLYLDSALVKAFWQNISESISMRAIRFFGLEHPFMMLLSGLYCLYILSKMRTKIRSKQGNRFLFFSILVLILIIFSSIPWQFSPFTSRPHFRFF